MCIIFLIFILIIKMNPSILAFNINVENIVLCDQYYNDKTTMEIPAKGFIFKRRACQNPLFFDDIEAAILTVKPTIIVITTEENKVGYFHSDFLPLEMGKLNYQELATYQYNSLNMSIYVQYTNNYNIIGYDTYQYGNNVDSLAIYCQTPYDVIAFVAITKPQSPNAISAQDTNKLITTILNQYSGYNNVTNAIIMGYIDKKEGDYNYINIINTAPSAFSIQRNETTAVIYGKYEGLMTLFDIKKRMPKILCFSWNTDKTPLCDQLHNSRTIQKRTRFFQSSPCYSPTFFTQIYQKIKEESPDIVVINTEGDLEKGTFFHQQFLKDHMKHYYLLANDKINGINTEQNPESLRMSIYIRHDMNASLDNVNATLFYKNDRTNSYITKDGVKITSKSMVKFVSTQYGLFAFMGLQFPHDFPKQNRQDAFTMMTNQLLKSNKIAYVFIMGDFASEQDEYNTLDSRPNYKLQQINEAFRSETDVTKLIYETQAWHDRILYNTVGPTSYDIVCTYYDNVFGFPMLNKNTRSQHLGIMGVYELDKVQI